MLRSRFPLFVDWAITGKCNLHCQHCRGMAKNELPTEKARKLIAEIAELQPGWVIIEGGEPLLREGLFELLDLLQQNRLEVHLITNGMLLTPQILTTLKQLGVKVMISIEGATLKTYEAIRIGSSFKRVVEAACECAREGLLNAINLTLIKTNYAEISGIFELAASLGVKVNILGLKPCFNYLEKLLTPLEYLEAIKFACQAALEKNVKFFFDEPFFWAIVKEWKLFVQMPAESAGILVPSTMACIFGEYLFIEPDGEVKPCSYSPLTLGNINGKSLTEIWSEALTSPFLHQIKDPKTRTGYCNKCPYLKECKGCCSRTFFLTKDWFAPDPVCPLRLKLVGEGG